MAAANAAQAAGDPLEADGALQAVGVGKSTLIARLLAEAPERFGFSSRARRGTRAGGADVDHRSTLPGKPHSDPDLTASLN